MSHSPSHSLKHIFGAGDHSPAPCSRCLFFYEWIDQKWCRADGRMLNITPFSSCRRGCSPYWHQKSVRRLRKATRLKESRQESIKQCPENLEPPEAFLPGIDWRTADGKRKKYNPRYHEKIKK